MIKEVTVFTNGDSGKLSTWSNVPYFFTETLLAKGITVNRVDLSPSPFVSTLFRRTVCQVVKLINKRTAYDYSRSLIHFFLSRRTIKRAIANYPKTDIAVFLTFSFSATELSTVPSIQFGDWTYDHYVKHFDGRDPDLFERAFIQREDKQIGGADWVFVLFPSVAEYMKSRYVNKRIHYLGNVINSLYAVSDGQLSQDKQASYTILFVGSKKYAKGANCLIDAYGRLRTIYPTLSVHIIGMTDADLVNRPVGVHCYGYLDKDSPTDRELYYSLLKRATLFVNTTPKWGAFSATIEAMYFHTPVIVSPYDEFVETFGRDIKFGSYCENDAVQLTSAISAVLNVDDNQYFSLCTTAHTAVEPFTWSSYIDKMLEKVGLAQVTAV